MKGSLGDRLTQRLAGFVKALENGEKISEQFTCRKIELNLEPQPYDKELVRATRKVLCLSQGLFAQFLGVSIQTVRAWEQGKKIPREVACRFMDEIRQDPSYWRERFRNLATRKTAV